MIIDLSFFTNLFSREKVRCQLMAFGGVLLFQTTIAQEVDPGQLSLSIPENILSISPQVAGFYKVNYFNTNYYSGVPNIDIPLHSMKLGTLEVPLSIKYNTLGVKVDDKGGPLGINWSLNSGGSIIRNIQDLPDNEVGYAATYIEDAYSGEFMIRPGVSGAGFNRKGAKPRESRLDWGPIASYRFGIYTEDIYNTKETVDFGDWGNPLSHYDAYPDIFNVSAPGLNTSFLAMNTSSKDIFPNNNTGFTVKFLDNGGHKMTFLELGLIDIKGKGFYEEYNLNSAYPLNAFSKHYDRADAPIKDFKQFKVISNDGFEYVFDEEEIQESFFFPTLQSDLPTSPLFSDNQALSIIVSNNYNKRISNWNLSQIKDLRSGDQINYIYETYSLDIAERSVSINRPFLVESQNFVGSCNYEIQTYRNSSTFSDSFESSIKRLKAKRLKKIVYNGGEIEFFYDDRSDYTGEKSLTSVKISEGNSFFYYDFYYDNIVSFEGDQGVDYRRLYLRKVDKRSLNIESFNTLNKEKLCEFSYYSPESLPRKGSLQQDYLGYFNGNGLLSSQTATNYHLPKLYFYQFNKEESLLPFKRLDVSGTEIGGNMDLNPNSNSTIGLLKTVVYPTGGGIKLNYENHRFLYMNQEYVAPGARVSSQEIFDATTLRKINYTYLNSDGKSSGSFNNIPVFGFLQSGIGTTTNIRPGTFSVYDKSRVNLELSAGTYIGYSQVQEEEVGLGSKEYEYTSPREFPNLKETRTGVTPCEILMINNSAFPSSGFVDNSYKQGKLKKVVFSDNSKNTIYEESYTYDDKIYQVLSYTGEHNFSDRERLRNATIHKISVSSSISVKNYLQNSKKTKRFFNNIAVEDNETYKYNDYGMIRETISDESNGKKKIWQTNRILDLGRDLPHEYLELVNSNRISEPLEEKVFVDNNLLYTITVDYDKFLNGMFYMPSKIVKNTGVMQEETKILSRTHRGNASTVLEKGKITAYLWEYNQGNVRQIGKAINAYAEEVSILTCDNFGHVISNHTDGMPAPSFAVPVDIFGYAISLPHGVGFIEFEHVLKPDKIYQLTFWGKDTDFANNLNGVTIYKDEVVDRKGGWIKRMIEFGNVQHPLSIECGLGFIKDVVIAPKESQVSVYHPKPFGGISTDIDAKGLKTEYKYDGFQRLKDVLDFEGNILKNYKYHYRP